MALRVGIFFVLCGFRADAASPSPSTPLFPLDEIRPGMKGVGKTIFSGTQIEEFQVEILGVLRNVAPQQSIILARLSGGPLEKTGVLAGMSGSPVYLDGRLAGAVALTFQFSKEPIAGITPIEQMIEAFQDNEEDPLPANREHAWKFQPQPEGGDPRLVAWGTPNLLPPAANLSSPVFWGGAETSLVRALTPLQLSGFTPEAIQYFQPQLRALGLVPIQGGGMGTGSAEMGDTSRLQPGSMISVQLVRGDLGMSADGTVTLVDGDRIYAFGHRFLSAGPTEIPFAESIVVADVPSYANSMKITTPGRLLGVIGQDRSSGIFGVLGRRAHMVPIELELDSGRNSLRSYHFEIVNDRFLLPFLVNMTVFSAIGSTERMLGESTLQVEQEIALNGLPDVKLENFISGAANAPVLAAQSVATPLAYLMQSELGPVDVRNIRLRILSTNRQMVQELEQVWSDKREVKPGESLELAARLRSRDGTETLQKMTVAIPPSLAPGPLTITVADGTMMDRIEAGRAGGPSLPKDAQQLVRAINKLRRNNRLYVRLSRWEPGFMIQGESFPSPPPSILRTFSADAALNTNVSPTFLSALADYEMDPLSSMVTGFKTITVTVKD